LHRLLCRNTKHNQAGLQRADDGPQLEVPEPRAVPLSGTDAEVLSGSFFEE
jgi:hypothetical protein